MKHREVKKTAQCHRPGMVTLRNHEELFPSSLFPSPASGDTVSRPHPDLSWEGRSQAWLAPGAHQCRGTFVTTSIGALSSTIPPSLLRGSRGQMLGGQKRVRLGAFPSQEGSKRPSEREPGTEEVGEGKGGKGRSRCLSGSPHLWGKTWGGDDCG